MLIYPLPPPPDPSPPWGNFPPALGGSLCCTGPVLRRVCPQLFVGLPHMSDVWLYRVCRPA